MPGTTFLIAAALLFSPFAACGGGGENSTPVGTPGTAFNVTMEDNKFEPNTLLAVAGATITISLTNKGQATHNMRIAGEDGVLNTDDDALSDPITIVGGKDGKVTWKAPAKPGEYKFQCDFHLDAMTGTIILK